MIAKLPVYNVIIEGHRVELARLEHGQSGHAAARKAMILRERDAIDLFQTKKTSGESFDGTYSFASFQTAKTFGMLRLKVTAEEIEDNLDRVQAYDGTSPTSER